MADKNSQPLDVLSNSWKTFWETTTIPGITNARDRRSKPKSKIWMAIFTVFSILTLLAVKNVVHEYTLYPVSTSVTVKHQNQVRGIRYIYNLLL